MPLDHLIKIYVINFSIPLYLYLHINLQKVKTATSAQKVKKTPASKARERIIRRAALEFQDGMYGK